MKTIISIFIIANIAMCYSAEVQPAVVLQESKDDYKNGNYDKALAGILWYIDNSVRIDPSLRGVRSSDGFDLFYKISRKAADGTAKYDDKMKGYLNSALSDTTDPSKGLGAVLPKNHENFLDYLWLAEKAQTNKEICKNFERLETVNPNLAKWEFSALAPHLAAEGMFEKMNKYVAEWSEEEKALEARMLGDYKLVREGAFNGETLMRYHLKKIKLTKLVYVKNKRDIDIIMLDSFCKINLTDDEMKFVEDGKQDF